jgi:hypothetical protein
MCKRAFLAQRADYHRFARLVLIRKISLSLFPQPMYPLYSMSINQAEIIALFRMINRFLGNLAPMPGVFPDHLPR